MALRRFHRTSTGTGKADADRTLAPAIYASNVMTPPSHTLPGRDSVRQLDETTGKFSHTDTLGVAEKSRVTTPNYSKRLPVSDSPPNSQLCEFL